MKLLIILLIQYTCSLKMDTIDYNEKINKLEKVYEKVVILENIITTTEYFDMTDSIFKYKEYYDMESFISKYKEYYELQEKSNIVKKQHLEEYKQYLKEQQIQTGDNIQQLMNKPTYKISTILEKQIEELNIKMRSIGGYIHSEFSRINDIYCMYFDNDPIYMKSINNIDIKLYKIVSFNLEKRKELQLIIDEYTSIDNIKSMLKELYKKKIDSYNITSI